MASKHTQVLDISGLDEGTLRRAQVFREPEAMEAVRAAMGRIRMAADAIRRGGLVAFPTETVYGLGADAFNAEAVRGIYEAKGRPPDNPTIVHIARASDISLLARRYPAAAVRLADAFWPGPLTMIFEKRGDVPDVTTGGLPTVGVRLPDSIAAIELIRLAGTPIAAPSANLSGAPSPTRAGHAVADLDGRVDIVLAGADCRVGIESTVVDMTADPPEVLRPGTISADDLAQESGAQVLVDPALLGAAGEGPRAPGAQVLVDPALLGAAGEAPRAPGMKYRHYAPKAEMIVVEGARGRVRSEIERLKALNERIGRRVSVLLFDEEEYVKAAHGFYAMLREADDAGADLILAGALGQDTGLGFAVMNRMMKAAGYRVVRV